MRRITTADHGECLQSCRLVRHHANNAKAGKTSAERLKGRNCSCQSCRAPQLLELCSHQGCRGNCSNQCLVVHVPHRRMMCQTLRQRLFHRKTGG